MYIPVNPDRGTSGVCLAESFADLYTRDHEADIGIIPCADGGTSLDQWQVGGLLFDHACYQAELASRTSTIAAVLWHQGESDCAPELYPQYEEKLKVILNGFRKRLGLDDVPILVGGLGDFLKDFSSENISKNYPIVNDALKRVAASDDMIGFVSAEGLGGNPDNIHFSAAALREFDERYYAEFRKLERADKVFVEKCTADQAIRNDIEVL
jgi:hypothetical protein